MNEPLLEEINLSIRPYALNFIAIRCEFDRHRSLLWVNHYLIVVRAYAQWRQGGRIDILATLLGDSESSRGGMHDFFGDFLRAFPFENAH
jgi:hypothetical protein